MKYAKWISVLMLLLISAVATAQMPPTERITAQVPFTFVVADHVVPRGACTIQSADPTGSLLVIRSPGAGVNVFVTASMTENKRIEQTYTLVFHRYGKRYYLAGLKLENSGIAYWFTPSNFEKELLARNVPATEEVCLPPPNNLGAATAEGPGTDSGPSIYQSLLSLPSSNALLDWLGFES